MNEKTTDLLCSICLSETKKDYKKKKKMLVHAMMSSLFMSVS